MRIVYDDELVFFHGTILCKLCDRIFRGMLNIKQFVAARGLATPALMIAWAKDHKPLIFGLTKE
jgi:hypothetical protein